MSDSSVVLDLTFALRTRCDTEANVKFTTLATADPILSLRRAGDKPESPCRCRPAHLQARPAKTLAGGLPMRPSSRAPDELRAVTLERGVVKYAEGSCMVKFGDTHVLVTATLEERLPPWLKGQGRGWVTAEYGMLPRATLERTRREASAGKQNGRTVEIQRLIGRSMRATRDMVKGNVLRDNVAAISCGIYSGTPVLDLDYAEDSEADTDANFVMTGDGRIIEVQGTAEKTPFTQDEFLALMALARTGVARLVDLQKMAVA